jgi:SAM-dependent methyltransferase
MRSRRAAGRTFDARDSGIGIRQPPQQLVDRKRIASAGAVAVTWLAEDADLWDTVFSESPARARFITRLAREVGPKVLDVGCATGSLCALLRRRGLDPAGVDINREFVAAARAKDAAGSYAVGDMKTFRLARKFDLVVCLGTTFSYNLTNAAVHTCLRNFRRHLAPGGRLVIDVLNAIAFIGPRPFLRSTRHSVRHQGREMTATIRHELDLQQQTMTEQVTWQLARRKARRDPPERLRLFFPQELAFHVEQAGFGDISLMDTYGKSTAAFDGRRLIVVATRSP